MTTRYARVLLVMTIVACASCGNETIAPSNLEAGRISTTIHIPIVSDAAPLDSCESTIIGEPAVSGDVALAPVYCLLIFRNNLIGTHEHIEDVATLPLTDGGEVIRIDCEDGLSRDVLEEGVTAVADILVTTEGCSNAKGPYIRIEGDIVIKTEYATTPLHIQGTTMFSKQPAFGGVGGNPIILFRFARDGGIPVSDEFLLGRCVQLSH